MRRLLLSILLCMVLLYSSIVPVVASETATLTIEPDKTQMIADGGETKITYTITVTPPEGREIGVFSFRLKPSGDMVLPTQAKVNGERVIGYVDTSLRYDVNTDSGVFKTFEYTPESYFFAAVGSTEGRRMTEEAQVLTITATIPAGSSGVYAMDAEFTVAPDGSGDSYIGKVVCAPVTVTDPNAGQTTGGNVAITGLDQPVSGETPDVDVTVTTGGNAETETTWYRDGEIMTDGVFIPGHTYTVVVHVKSGDVSFDPTVYANQGYTVKRLSDTELELTRSFLVEEKFTQELTEEEAAERIAASSEQGSAESAVPAVQEAQHEQTGHGWLIAVAAAAIAAAVAAVLWRKKKAKAAKA